MGNMPKLELLQWEHVNNNKALKIRSVNNAAVHINGVNVKFLITYKNEGGTKELKTNGVRHHNLEGDMILYLAAHLMQIQNIVLPSLLPFFSRYSKKNCIGDCIFQHGEHSPLTTFWWERT